MIAQVYGKLVEGIATRREGVFVMEERLQNSNSLLVITLKSNNNMYLMNLCWISTHLNKELNPKFALNLLLFLIDFNISLFDWVKEFGRQISDCFLRGLLKFKIILARKHYDNPLVIVSGEKKPLMKMLIV